jgi:hypothetical protein
LILADSGLDTYSNLAKMDTVTILDMLEFLQIKRAIEEKTYEK